MSGAIRKAEGGVSLPIMLVLATIVAIVILAIGIGALSKVKKEGNDLGSEYRVAEAVAYSQIKSKCMFWRGQLGGMGGGAYLEGQCQTSPDSCRSSFMDTAFKTYGIMFYSGAARLEKSVYFDRVRSTRTLACIRASETLSAGVSKEDDAQALLQIANSLEAKYQTPTGKQEILDIAMSCAKICEWVATREAACERGPANCAQIAIDLDEGILDDYLP